jgi:Fic family protein
VRTQVVCASQSKLGLLPARTGLQLSTEEITEHAKNQALDVIFHSNKIEGSSLTRGETENALSQTIREGMSERDLEAKNLEAAYYWMLEHYESCFDQPEAFIREMNRLII